MKELNLNEVRATVGGSEDSFNIGYEVGAFLGNASNAISSGAHSAIEWWLPISQKINTYLN